MGNLAERGAAWLRDKLQANASREVVYSRGASSVTLRATPGSTLLQLDDGTGGTRIERTDRDFLIPAADLVLGGVAVHPERGDEIREADGGVTYVFEVLPYGGTEPCWRWADHYRNVYRIHAKLVGTE